MKSIRDALINYCIQVDTQLDREKATYLNFILLKLYIIILVKPGIVKSTVAVYGVQCTSRLGLGARNMI